jgi:ankyrin repeat protein
MILNSYFPSGYSTLGKIINLMIVLNIHLDTKDTGGNTVLLRAAENGHLDIVTQLHTKKRMDINMNDDFGRTPLRLAIRNRYLPTALYLWQYGTEENKIAALIEAAERGCLRVLTALCANPPVPVNEDLLRIAEQYRIPSYAKRMRDVLVKAGATA